MAFKPVFNSSQKYSDDKIVVIDIYQKLKNLPVNEQNSGRVCICRVPKSLSSTNPEHFLPRFVGLGPYHHLGGELTMTDEMKLGVANRVPKVKDLITDNGDMFDKHLSNYVSDIQSLYHTDVCSTYDSQSLLYLLTVDGLFLLGLFYSSNHEENLSHYYYILTGRKQGMPLINPAGVELTTDGVIQDVFMLENQIPTHVLKHLNRVNIKSKSEIQSRDQDLGLAMRNFCEQFCPLVHSENLSNNPEDHDHLLDLMYHLIASQFEPEPEPEPEPETKADNKFSVLRWITICVLLLNFVFMWTFVYYIMLIFSLVLSLLVMVRWVLTFLFGKLRKMPSLFKVLGDQIDSMRQDLSKNEAGKPYAQILGQIQERTSIFMLLLQRQLVDNWWKKKAATLPSAIELHSVGVRLQPAEGGISSFKFEEGTRRFYLPSVRLDAKSEVIMRNLVTYESLTKSNGLIFTRYIELMSALILSAEDVKRLADENIIQTRLSHQIVAEIFSGMMMNKSTRPTMIRNLEEEIKKVRVVYQKILSRRMTLPLVLFIIIFIIGAALALSVVDSLVESHCSNNHDSILCKLFQIGDYGLRNNYMISSM